MGDDEIVMSQFPNKFTNTGRAGKWNRDDVKRKTIELQERDGGVPLKTHMIYNESRSHKTKKAGSTLLNENAKRGPNIKV